MKKIFTLIAAALMTVGASAFTDTWSSSSSATSPVTLTNITATFNNNSSTNTPPDGTWSFSNSYADGDQNGMTVTFAPTKAGKLSIVLPAGVNNSSQKLHMRDADNKALTATLISDPTVTLPENEILTTAVAAGDGITYTLEANKTYTFSISGTKWRLGSFTFTNEITVFSTDFSSSDWSSYTSTSPITAGTTVNGIYFSCADYIANDALYFNGGNNMSNARFCAIPLTGINGSVTITFTVNQNSKKVKYDFTEGATMSSPTSSVESDASASNIITITKTISGSDAWFYFYRQGSGALNIVKSIKITTLAPTAVPTITTDLPATATATVGIAKDFSIAANGASSYQWYKNGTKVEGATSSTYSYTAAAAGDETLYCEAINSLGKATSTTCTVTAAAAPLATSIDFETEAKKEAASQTAVADLLANNNYYISSMTQVAYDAPEGKPADAGLKIKNAGTTITFRVAANKQVTLTVGSLNGLQISVNGGTDFTDLTGSNPAGTGDDVVTKYSDTAERIYVIKTTTASYNIIKSIAIGDPTAINEVNAAASKANGVVKTANYIIKGGKKYNYAGQQVK